MSELMIFLERIDLEYWELQRKYTLLASEMAEYETIYRAIKSAPLRDADCLAHICQFEHPLRMIKDVFYQRPFQNAAEQVEQILNRYYSGELDESSYRLKDGAA